MSVFDADESSPVWLLAIKVIVGVAMILGGPVIAFATVPTFLAAYRSKSWPETTATIAHAEVKQINQLGRHAIEYNPIVEYKYEVEDKAYTGDNVAYRGYGSPDEQDALDLIAKYAVGSRHQVYYNPASPGESVLERGTHWLTYAGLVIPVGLLLAGGFMVNDHVRVLRRRFA